MRKSIRNGFVFAIVFALFSILFCTGGVSLCLETTAEAELENAIGITDATDLENRIKNYGSTGAVSNYYLTKDIDMSGIVLNNTLGNETNPFKGTFDGRGFTIKNLSFDLSKNIQGGDVVTPIKYVGLFGVTDGATISNLSIAGTTSIKIGECTTANVGTLVASARNTKIKYVQNISSISFDTTSFNHSLVFGGLVGSANSTNIAYVINRSDNMLGLNFADNNSRIYSLGGVVGTMSESSLVWAFSKTNLNITVEDTFVGSINAGGVFGTISGSGVFDGIRVATVNLLVENNITLTNNQPNFSFGRVYVGQVGGEIASPYPQTLGISSIYFKKNQSPITAFGQKNSYAFQNGTTNDNVLETNASLNDAFAKDPSNKWHPLLGGWDFDTIWYSSGNDIRLQSFYGRFSVSLVNDFPNIFKIEQTFEENYSYGSTAEFKFSFKQTDSDQSLSHYYILTGLKHGTTDNAVSFSVKDGVYSVSTDPENYSISESGGIYTVQIKNINRKTAGSYGICKQEKEFKVVATSRLYDSQGVLQGGEPPAIINNVGGTGTGTKPLEMNMHYETKRSIETRLRSSNLPYAFDGWYLENEGGDIQLTQSNNSVLEIVFGTGNFTDNKNVYAKYINDACVINFDVRGDGIAEIRLGENLVEGKVATVSKATNNLKLELSIKEGYTFDVQRFLDMLSTYKGDNTERPFCTWTNEETSDGRYYVFNLDMTTLKDQFATDGFAVEIDTEKEVNKKSNLIWYIVGGVGGAVVLGVIIFLIVFFTKRRKSSGFGGKKGGYGGRKSFKKGGYY